MKKEQAEAKAREIVERASWKGGEERLLSKTYLEIAVAEALQASRTSNVSGNEDNVISGTDGQSRPSQSEIADVATKFAFKMSDTAHPPASSASFSCAEGATVAFISGANWALDRVFGGDK